MVKQMKIKLNEIAKMISGEIADDVKDIEITGLSDIKTAQTGDLIFAVAEHLDEAKTTSASAVIVPLDADELKVPVIRVAEPKAAFAKLLTILVAQPQVKVEISDKAQIGEGVEIGKNVTIMAYAVIDDYAKIESGAIIYPHTYIGQYAQVGANTTIYSNVTIRENCKIGKNCIIHASAVIGADGFGFTTKDGIHTKVPQVGNVVVENDVEIGANVGIDRAAMGSTVIGHGTKIDNLVHIGHNCKIGANCLIVAQTGISGSTIVGDNVTFGGQVGTVGHIKIGGNSVYAARSGISKNMPENFFGAGFPIQTHADWLKTQAAIKKLPELIKQVKQLLSNKN